MKSTGMRLAGAIVAAGLLAASARASMLSFESVDGNEGLGFYSGTMEWQRPGKDEDCGTLLVTLWNESPEENGGFLTGFAFRVTDGLLLTYLGDNTASGDSWEHISNVNAHPYGMYDYGAAIGGNWLGGGSPHAGIAAGEMRAFAFEVCGDPTLLESVDAFDFFDETEGYGFVARFKGFEGGGSDKVPAVAPGPGALALAVVGGIALRRRMR